jgi:hypothetical protein
VALFALAVAACGGGKGKEHDAAVARDAAPARLDAAVRAPDSDGGVGGRVRVKVEWVDAPAEVRASAGRDRCGEPRPGYARVHTLHGVADVVVWIEGDGGATSATPATVTIRRCHLEPAVQLGAGAVRVQSLVEGRVAVTVTAADAIGEDEPTTPVAAFALPVVGHTMEVPVTAGVIAVTSGVSDDPAYVVVPPAAHAAVTDDTGAALLDGVSEGEHPVVAWLHGGAGRPARLIRGTVTVERGGTAEVTLSLVPGVAPPPPKPGDEPEPEPEP